jgi:hypothetical protein
VPGAALSDDWTSVYFVAAGGVLVNHDAAV